MSILELPQIIASTREVALGSIPIKIRLFGEVSVTLANGSSVSEFGPQRAALLARLALEPGRAIPREVIVEYLWPDDDPEESRRRLRQLVFNVRQALGDEVLISTRSTLALDSERVEVDARRFESLIKEAEAALDPSEKARLYSLAVELYQGELAPGLYQDYILGERDRLADLAYHSLHALSEAHAGLGELNEAVVAARKAISTNPTGEEAYCALMRLYARQGKSSAVLRQYRELEWKQINGDSTGDPADAGNSNPDSNFRYDSESQCYVYNFSTKSLPGPGTYELGIAVAGDPRPHTIQFKVR